MGLAFNVEVRLCSVPIPHLQLFFFFFISQLSILESENGDAAFFIWRL